eukprot:m.103378 g.103378  ORF g.103378 m.103378 type:complete len:250 (+) comp37190_c0_seq55:2750-3499(+)
MHPDFIDAAVAPAEGVEKRHITEVEGAISSSLINTGIMVNEECRDYQRKRVNHFWKVQMVNESRDISDSQLRVSYKISEILGTNSFLIIATQSGSFQCPCDETKSFSSRECVRPCSVPFSYDECTGVDSAADSSVSVCPPKSPSLSIPSKTSNPGTGFAPCFNIDCSSNTQKRSAAQLSRQFDHLCLFKETVSASLAASGVPTTTLPALPFRHPTARKANCVSSAARDLLALALRNRPLDRLKNRQKRA